MNRTDEYFDFVRKFGTNNNSFMSLYPGFRYFSSSVEGVVGFIAYVELSHSWIAAAEPIAPPESVCSLLLEFAEAAAISGRIAIFLPTRGELAREAIKLGFGHFQIGSEPIFQLDQYPKTGKSWMSVVPSCKLVAGRGARVFEVFLKDCSASIRAEMDSITTEWLATRKIDPLGFLNQVDPWQLSEHKKYFCIEIEGCVLAFIAAVPVWATQSWYLIDVMRRSSTPAGTTEFLILSAMRMLKECGAKSVTLGVAPLALVAAESLEERLSSEPNKMVKSVIDYMFHKGDWFYNFKSIFEYKLKFFPTKIEPVYLLYKCRPGQTQKLKIWHIINIMQAFTGRGLIFAFYANFVRAIQRFSFHDAIEGQLNDHVIVLPRVCEWREFFWRFRLTLLLSVINLGMFLVTRDHTGNITPLVLSRWGYTWEFFSQSPVKALLLSPFLHLDLHHMTINFSLLCVAVGIFEYLMGTLIMGSVYLVGMILSNPLTSLFLKGFRLFQDNSIDVGASLGIFACGGALSWILLRRRWTFILPASLISLIQAYFAQQTLILNHWVAIVLGVLMGRFAIKYYPRLQSIRIGRKLQLKLLHS